MYESSRLMHKPNERHEDTQKLIKKMTHTPRTDCSRNSAMVSVLPESNDRANINSPSTSMKFSFSRSRRRQSGCRTRDYMQTNTHIYIHKRQNHTQVQNWQSKRVHFAIETTEQHMVMSCMYNNANLNFC